MPIEIQKFVHTNEVGLPEGHQLKYRIRENENTAYDRMRYYRCDNNDYYPSPAPSNPSPGDLTRDWDGAWREWERENQPERPKPHEERSIELDDPWFDDPPFRHESRLGFAAEKACGLFLSKYCKVSHHMNNCCYFSGVLSQV